MDSREKLTERLKKIAPEVNIDELIVPFEYTLTKTESHTRVDGLCAVLNNSILVFENGVKIAEYDLDKAKEFRCTAGIGCAFVECIYDGNECMICRADMKYHRLYAAIVKRLNRYVEDRANGYGYDYEKDITRCCEKCGRPFRPGATFCEHCVDKRTYLKRIWQIAHPYRFYIYASVVLYFIITACSMLMPYINRVLVDEYIDPKKDSFAGFITVILSLLGVNVAIRLLTMCRSLTLIRAGNKVIVRLRELVFDKIQQLSISRISKRTSGELMNRVTGDTATLQQFITHDVGNVIEQILLFVGVGFFLFYYDWKLALMIFIPMPLVMSINKAFWGRLHRMYHRQWTFNAKASTILHDIFSGIRVVKAFGMEHREIERYDEVTAAECQIQIKNEQTYAIISPIINFLMGVGEFFLLYYVGSKIISAEMTLGEMAQFSAYVSMIYGPLRWLSNLPRRLIRVMTSIVKIFDIIDEKIDVADHESAKEMDIEGYIDFDNVSFGYDDTVDVLKKIDLHIKPGEMIGIVGKSGVGKSTLINLVMRLYDANEGSIKIDGVDIKEISQDSLRSQIGVVLQETFLFSGTIYDNIAYAKPGATRDEVITAAKIAGAHQFIMKLPEAYNTKVGERGHTLSGGERQRVSIARALLHDPRILILDEATASLDTETEKQIQDSLQKLIKDRTTLAIAHRLSTLRNATRLIVLDKGTVAEVGTHDELMRSKGIYYGLVMAQRQMSKMTRDDKSQTA